MSFAKTTLIRATLTVIGTIIGAGVFGVPAMIGRYGLRTGSVLFVIASLAVLATHLLFIELLIRNHERMRLPGVVGRALGPWAKRVAFVTHACQHIGATLAYLILGGQFLWFAASRLGFSLLPASVWTVMFWATGAVIVAFALKVVAKIESGLTWALIGTFLLVVCFAAFRVDLSRLAPSVAVPLTLAPFGVFLFATFGLTAIPEVYEIVGRRARSVRIAVTVGTLVAVALTWLFGVTVAAALPVGTASNIATIALVLPSALWWILPVVGVLAIITSFITEAYDLQSMIVLDLKRSATTAYICTTGVPLALFFLVTSSFVNVIGTVGALFTAANGFLVTVSASRMMEAEKTVPWWWRTVVPFACAALFIVIILERAFRNAVY